MCKNSQISDTPTFFLFFFIVSHDWPFSVQFFRFATKICFQLRRVNNLHLAVQPKYETPDSLHVAHIGVENEMLAVFRFKQPFGLWELELKVEGEGEKII